MKAIAAYVYARPPGEVKQEAAGVAVTLFALAEAHRFDLLLETEKEIERITHLPARIPQQKQAAKAAAGVGRFPGSSTSGLIGQITEIVGRTGGCVARNISRSTSNTSKNE
ncbi:MAG: hypothetical protein ACYCOR_00165 [Acidobacteriaceae bacterium]